MKNLSLLIREAASEAYWRIELETVANANGMWNRADIDVAWHAVRKVLESIEILAFEYRHRSDELGPAFHQWLSNQQRMLSAQSGLIDLKSAAGAGEPKFDRIVLAIVGRALAEFETARERHEQLARSKQVLNGIETPKLDHNQLSAAQDAAAHLKKAVARIKQLQQVGRPSEYAWEIYVNVIEAAYREFEEMGAPIASTFDEAA